MSITTNDQYITEQLQAGIQSSDIIKNSENLLWHSVRRGHIRLSQVPNLLANIGVDVMREELELLKSDNNGGVGGGKKNKNTAIVAAATASKKIKNKKHNKKIIK